MKYLTFSIYIFLWSIQTFAQNIDVDPIHKPILKGDNPNPVFRIHIESGQNEILQSVELGFDSANASDEIATFSVFTTGADSTFHDEKKLDLLDQDISNAGLSLTFNHQLKTAESYMWLACQLRDAADLVQPLSLSVKKIVLGNAVYHDPATWKSTTFRYGLALRKHNQDGVHTTRIPGLATSAKGTLLAIFDARWHSSRDLQGDIDIGLHRSFDGGESWEPLQIVMDMGEWGNLPEKFNGVSDASILVHGDEIYVAGLWMHGVINEEGEWVKNLDAESDAWNHQWRNKGSQPGFDPKVTSQFLLTKSTDDGENWSKPVNLTTSCKKEEWWLWAPAPGRGIVMEDGTLVFPTQGRDKNGLPFSNITYSQDGGNTWHTSNAASHNTTECSVVEYESGKLMLNIRDNRNRQDKSVTNGRAVFTTGDLGESWTEHPTSHGSLIEPVCMASLHKHDLSGDELLLFSNPRSKHQRINQTLRMSFDRGLSWPDKYNILLDEGKGRGYSCITSIDHHTIGIVYEGSRADLIFQKIDLSRYLEDSPLTETDR